MGFTYVPTIYENVESYFIIDMFALESFTSQFLSLRRLLLECFPFCMHPSMYSGSLLIGVIDTWKNCPM